VASTPADSTHTEVTTKDWLILTATSIGSFSLTAALSMMFVAIPSMSDDLGASVSATQWTVIMSTLLMAALSPLFGRLSDIQGRRHLFALGLFIYALGMGGSAMSWDIPSLVGARVVAGIGASMSSVTALAIVIDTFPAGKRGLALGFMGMVTNAAFLLGPTLGGVLVTNFGWRSIFWFNVVLGFIVAPLAWKVVPSRPPVRPGEPIDGWGALALVVALSGLIITVSMAPFWGWTSRATAMGAIIAAAGLGAFVAREISYRYPLVDLRVFRVGAFAGGLVAFIVVTLVTSSMNVMLPFFWQGVHGLSAQESGFLMLAIPIPLISVSVIAGRLSDKLPPRRLTTTGMLAILAGVALFAALPAQGDAWDAVWRVALIGMGLGLFTAPNQNLVMSSVPATQRGMAAGLTNVARFSASTLGYALSGAVFGTMMAAQLGSAAQTGSPADFAAARLDPATLSALRDAFFLGIRVLLGMVGSLLAVGIVFSAILARRKAPLQS
jgi:EmrB/QacA subfamily drug resistance transporter